MMRNLLFAGLTLLISITVSAQEPEPCMDWASPTPPDVYFTIGHVPCTGQSRVTGYEVDQSEAYLLAGVMEGDNFTFNICDGEGAGSWIPEFTVITPTGEVDNFGAGDGDGCSITWTASETGTYTIVINEAGNCGVGGSTGNGYPMITTNSGGIPCPEFLEGAESFESDDLSLPDCWMAVDADGDTQNWVVVTDEDGGYGFDGDNAIASYSYISGVGSFTPDNYLITPQVTLGDNDSLYYAVRSLNHNYSEEEYQVLVSTTGTEIADFTDEVFADNLEFINQWQARTVNLSAYANQTIYLAFRHHGTSDLVGFLIDAVKLPGVVNCNPSAVTELDEVKSSLFPNPATDNVTITSSLQGSATVHIFDALGRVVFERNVNLSGAGFTQNISSLEKGMYTIRISTADRMSTSRFVKQ